MSDVFISIQLNSNRPEQIRLFLESIESTAEQPECIEVLIHIDEGDVAMESVLMDESRARKLIIRPHQTALVQNGFPDLWKPLNELLAMTDPQAYLVMNASDDFIFETKGWDSILRSYTHYYPDDIFRIRCSQFRFRNYQDLWECGFAPDSLAFYTKRWLDIVGQWSPCIGPDSFQQCIAFHLSSIDPFGRQYYRDIADPLLRFSGEGTANGHTGKEYMQILRMHYREWFRLMSPQMQQQAKHAAMKIAAHLVVANHSGGSLRMVDDGVNQHMKVVDDGGVTIHQFKYEISAWKIRLSNAYRTFFFHYYGGGGKKCSHRWSPFKEIAYMLWCRYDWVYRYVNKSLMLWYKCKLPLMHRYRKYLSS